MRDLTRAEHHEIADLFEQIRLWERGGEVELEDEPDWAEVEAWADRLRSSAGPVEPTSYAARAMTASLPHRLWAKSPEDGLWYAMNGSRTDGLHWDALLAAYEDDGGIEIITPQEG